MATITTLSEFIMDRQAEFPFASGELSRLLADIGIASKIVNKQVNKAGLQDILGSEGTENVQGETQQKLDVYADVAFINYFKSGGLVCGIGSEENDEYLAFDTEISKRGKYVVVFARFEQDDTQIASLDFTDQKRCAHPLLSLSRAHLHLADDH